MDGSEDLREGRGRSGNGPLPCDGTRNGRRLAIDEIGRACWGPRPHARASERLYTNLCIHAYKMTTLRLSAEQKEVVRKAAEVLERSLGRRLSQGEAAAALAEFALRNRAALANSFASETMNLAEDPFYDTSLVFDAGPTDARSLDRLLYGRR